MTYSNTAILRRAWNALAEWDINIASKPQAGQRCVCFLPYSQNNPGSTPSKKGRRSYAHFDAGMVTSTTELDIAAPEKYTSRDE